MFGLGETSIGAKRANFDAVTESGESFGIVFGTRLIRSRMAAEHGFKDRFHENKMG